MALKQERKSLFILLYCIDIYSGTAPKGNNNNNYSIKLRLSLNIVKTHYKYRIVMQGNKERY